MLSLSYSRITPQYPHGLCAAGDCSQRYSLLPSSRAVTVSRCMCYMKNVQHLRSRARISCGAFLTHPSLRTNVAREMERVPLSLKQLLVLKEGANAAKTKNMITLCSGLTIIRPLRYRYAIPFDVCSDSKGLMSRTQATIKQSGVLVGGH